MESRDRLPVTLAVLVVVAVAVAVLRSAGLDTAVVVVRAGAVVPTLEEWRAFCDGRLAPFRVDVGGERRCEQHRHPAEPVGRFDDFGVADGAAGLDDRAHAGLRRRVGARETAGAKAEPLRFGAYCFLEALASIHGRQLHPCPLIL